MTKNTKKQKSVSSIEQLNKANRKAGTYGNGDDMDMSHTKSGKIVKEKSTRNRSRNGQNGKSSKK